MPRSFNSDLPLSQQAIHSREQRAIAYEAALAIIG
jgi:hypothetical protein